MEELLKRLQRLDENGDEAAGNLYWEAVDIPKEQFPLWVAQNDRELRKVLRLDETLLAHSLCIRLPYLYGEHFFILHVMYEHFLHFFPLA